MIGLLQQSIALFKGIVAGTTVDGIQHCTAFWGMSWSYDVRFWCEYDFAENDVQASFWCPLCSWGFQSSNPPTDPNPCNQGSESYLSSSFRSQSTQYRPFRSQLFAKLLPTCGAVCEWHDIFVAQICHCLWLSVVESRAWEACWAFCASDSVQVTQHYVAPIINSKSPP